MEWTFDHNPNSKTPQAMDTYATIVKRVDHHIEVTGLSPLASWNIKKSVDGKPIVPVVPERTAIRAVQVTALLARSGALTQAAMQAEERGEFKELEARFRKDSSLTVADADAFINQLEEDEED